MEILVFLGEHFIDVLFSLVSAGLLYLCRKVWKDKEEYKKIINANKNEILIESVKEALADKLSPIEEKLTTLEEDVNKLTKKEKSDVSLILDSEKTRLIEEGTEYIKRGNVTADEFQHLTHLYNNYQKLGGNGEAQKIYERVKTLPTKG